MRVIENPEMADLFVTTEP